MMRSGASRRSFLARSVATLAGAASLRAQPAGVPVVLDTDTYNEIDDQFAVAYAMLSPSLSVQAIYAAPFLNNRSKSPADGMEKSYEEIHRVLDALGKKGAVEVFKGSRAFMKGPGQPARSDAARDLIKKAMAVEEGRLHVITLGAPTNVSSALVLQPAIKDKITIVWLGGTPYDSASAKEFNLQQDPAASRVLFDTSPRLVNVPARGVAESLSITTPELEQALKGKSHIADYLFNIFVEYERDHHKDSSKPWSKVIWDISAVAWLVNPNWVPTTMVPSPILTPSLTWQHNPDRHGVRVATKVDRDAVFADLFQKLTAAG
ncbi:MAG: nucleoside hydrolase [Bryobacteraceae bacterium]|nr:nucleoside hydrolase [Bryobacteraceae bacterium]